jgi:hypothetical protein
MESVRKIVVFPLLALMLASSSAFADQQHVLTPSQLSATVADGVAKQDANRAAVHEALARPEVQAVASKLGLDLTRADAAVDVMNGSELEKAANAAQQVNDELVGGASTVVISTTTIIIVLLLVIILVIALR